MTAVQPIRPIAETIAAEESELDALCWRLAEMPTADAVIAERLRLSEPSDAEASDLDSMYSRRLNCYDSEVRARMVGKRCRRIDRPSPSVYLESDSWVESDLPLRPWVAPGYLLRRTVTLVVAPGGTMKSSLMLGWAISLALGKEWGGFKPLGKHSVLIYNAEDSDVEQCRRLSAALRQWEACPDDLQGRITRAIPAEGARLFAEGPDRALIPTPALAELETYIKYFGHSVLIIDPLAEVHPSDENSNGAMNAVCAAFRGMAQRLNIAVVLVHHTRKGAGTAAPGDADVARGGSSIIGAVRTALTLSTMSEADAQSFGLPTDRANRSNYIRLDDAKANYSAIGDARWFEKVAYDLDNGEHVPAAVPWTPPAAKTASVADLDTLAAAVKAGTPAGEPFSAKLSNEARSIRRILIDQGFVGSDSQKAAIAGLVETYGMEPAPFRSLSRTRAMGLRIDGLPVAAWVEK